MSEVGLEQVYSRRFGPMMSSRRVLWETLCEHFFQRYIDPNDTVIDLPAGYCEFINAISCKNKIAVDLNEGFAGHAGPGVRPIRARSTELPRELDGCADVVFVSNFFEHLADSDELLATLEAIKGALKPTGKLLVLQPNIRLTGGRYWDFIDHTLAITDRSLVEALELSGYAINELKVRFLPYTMQTWLPTSPSLIRLYLRFPPAQFVLGQQTFVVASPSATRP